MKTLIKDNFKSSPIVKEKNKAKPFLKWAGGKSQIINELEKRLPDKIKETKIINRYIEPFIGGGALFFYLKNKYFIKKAFLFDINVELIIGYKIIKNNYRELITKLKKLERTYLKYNNNQKEKLYYQIRDYYNHQRTNFNYDKFNFKWIERASYLIFLNKTCYNGLFRQNKNGEFNVPFGKYKNPSICNENNIIEVHKALQNTEIICDDFYKSRKYIIKNSLVYLDPPYRPLNATSGFTQYAKYGFNDNDQIKLANYYKGIDKKGAFIILSNSDPKNVNPDDNFFDLLYKEYHIERVLAKRFINCDAKKRGTINEIIVGNY